jgi:hypothetical protein
VLLGQLLLLSGRHSPAGPLLTTVAAFRQLNGY